MNKPDKSRKMPLTLAALGDRNTCSIEQAARILGVGRSTAYAAARDGSLPTLRISHRLLVPVSYLARVLQETVPAGEAQVTQVAQGDPR
jgi:excisionase family DNA binding protein